MNKEKFSVSIPDQTLADLRERLRRTRFAPEFANAQWEYGTNGLYLKELIEYWRNTYDWRKAEREINSFAHYKTVIEGIPIHFIHESGKGPKPIPLIMSHGWPWTFWDFHKVIRPLADPAAYGGDPRDAFDVVVPSLPGYGFSEPLTTPGINYWRTADLWVTLMRDILGYDKFAAQGGDWGAIITAQLGHKYAQHLIGIHVHLLVNLDFFGGNGGPKPEDFGPGEETWLEHRRKFMREGSGYMALQSTRPQTAAFAFNDSPAGLCSWILEKRRAWSDCGGNVERRFSKDDLCTTMTLYWATQTYGTSARYYYEAAHNPWQPSHDRRPVVEAPTGAAIFLQEVFLLPRKWAERYYNLKRWTVMPSGGHFAPMEEPERLIEEIRAFFHPLRT
ncbi:MAG: epoxide hydrolase family protein [Candidatus Binataceae bacterium]|jgi:pimeloyl-ACP methyl ester carboxylesterase